MSVPSDDDVVVDENPQRPGDIGDLAGHVDVGLGRSRVARGVVVHQDHGGGRQFERPFNHLARVDRRVVDGSGLLQLVGDDAIALVEKEDPELLALGKRHRCAAIVEHG